MSALDIEIITRMIKLFPSELYDQRLFFMYLLREKKGQQKKSLDFDDIVTEALQLIEL